MNESNSNPYEGPSSFSATVVAEAPSRPHSLMPREMLGVGVRLTGVYWLSVGGLQLASAVATFTVRVSAMDTDFATVRNIESAGLPVLLHLVMGFLLIGTADRIAAFCYPGDQRVQSQNTTL